MIPVARTVRLVRGERGRVDLKMELVIRCEYGSIVPWVRREPRFQTQTDTLAR